MAEKHWESVLFWSFWVFAQKGTEWTDGVNHPHAGFQSVVWVETSCRTGADQRTQERPGEMCHLFFQ